jgi:hypothetical protein
MWAIYVFKRKHSIAGGTNSKINFQGGQNEPSVFKAYCADRIQSFFREYILAHKIAGYPATQAGHPFSFYVTRFFEAACSN